MKTFKEMFTEDDDLTEQAIARWGDWQPKKDRVASKTLRSLRADYEQIDTPRINSVFFRSL